MSTRVAKRFVNPLTTRWVFSDIEHKLWVELAISARSDAKVDQAQFISSLELSSHKGKEIGTGSPNMLGDAGVDVNKYGPVAPIPSDHYGIPNGTDRLSDGPGTGTGIGTGRGRADLGSGNGTGLGSSSKGLGVERMALGAPLHQGRTVKTKPTP